MSRNVRDRAPHVIGDSARCVCVYYVLQCIIILYYVYYTHRCIHMCVWRLRQSDNSRWHTWFIGPLTLLDRIIICRENELRPVSTLYTCKLHIIYKCQYVYYIWILCVTQIYTIKPNKLCTSQWASCTQNDAYLRGLGASEVIVGVFEIR